MKIFRFAQNDKQVLFEGTSNLTGFPASTSSTAPLLLRRGAGRSPFSNEKAKDGFASIATREAGWLAADIIADESSNQFGGKT